jgi:hypothetical protein
MGIPDTIKLELLMKTKRILLLLVLIELLRSLLVFAMLQPFQSYMMSILSDMVEKFIEVLMDDFLVFYYLFDKLFI